MLYIKLKGVEYPARLVMGALLAFKRETGKDVSAMDDGNLEEVLMLLWCCVKSTCQGEGKAFAYNFETFCNVITPDDVRSWTAHLGAEKKKAPDAVTDPKRA